MIAEVSMTYGHYTNLIGVIICAVIIFCSRWRLKERSRENNILLGLLACVIVSCIADSFAVWVDGRPGSFYRFCVYASNIWLFIANIFSGFLWIMFMEENIHGANSLIHLRILQTISIVGVLVLIINMYLPIVFSVNGNNVYEREPAFFIYIVIELSFLFDSIAMYMRAKYFDGGISVFPIWIYVIPLLIGMVAQLLIYGTSFIWPSAAVAMACLIFRFNKEDRYKDINTGVYLERYVREIGTELRHNRCRECVLIYINILGLVAVKANHGSEAEQQVKNRIIKVINETVKPNGIVLAADGDSYAVILSALNEARVDECEKHLNEKFDEINKENRMKYSLNVTTVREYVDLDEDDLKESLDKARGKI